MRLAAIATTGIAVLCWWLLSSNETPRTSRSPRPATETTTATTTTTSTDTTTPEAEQRPTTPEAKPWRVRLIAQGGAPVPGVRVAFSAKLSLRSADTDADGWATLRDDMEVDAVSAEPFFDDRKIRARTTVIRLRLLPLEVVLKDVVSGAVVAGGKVTLKRDSFRLALKRVGAVHRAALAPIRAGHGARFELQVEAPPGHSGPAYIAINEGVSRMATRVRVEIPVGPEIRQRVRVLDERGYPVEGARASHVYAMSEQLTYSSEPSDRAGWLELRRLGYARRYGVFIEADESSEAVEFERGAESVVVRLEAEPGEPEVPEEEIVEEEIEFEEKTEEPEETLARLPTGKQRLEVRCVRANGRPAAGVDVVIVKGEAGAHRLADAKGIAVFDRLPPGLYQAIVRDAAFRSPVVDVAASDGRLILREQPGRTVFLRVRSAPLLQLRGGPGRVVDGVQHAGVFTDLQGRVTLVGVPTEEFTLGTDLGALVIPANVSRCELRVR